jgi:type I restriction enzyme S subunit
VAEWPEVALPEVLEFREGPGIMARDFRTSGVPLVRLAGVKQGAHILDGCNYLDPSAVEQRWKHFRLAEGDVLLSTSASLGEVAVVGPEGAGAVPYTGLIGFRPVDARMSPRFIRFALTSSTFKRQIEAMGVGSVMRHFGPMHLRRMTVQVPSRDVQEAIAEVVGALDDKIAANTCLAKMADDLAGTIYVHETRGMPAVPMSSVLSPILGGTPPRANRDLWGGTRLWISAKDVTSAAHGVVLDTEEKITALGVSNSRAKPLPKGSVILTARGTVGAVARLCEPASFNQSCYGFVPGAVPASVLYFGLKAATERAKAIAHGSVFDTITMAALDYLEIPRFAGPTAAALEAQLASLLHVVEQTVRQNRNLAATRDALLPALMSGKLRVRDAERAVEQAV